MIGERERRMQQKEREKKETMVEKGTKKKKISAKEIEKPRYIKRSIKVEKKNTGRTSDKKKKISKGNL